MSAISPLSFRFRSVGMAASIALVASLHAMPAQAQTTVRMTTVSGQSCVAVTDANGLTLVPGSTDLQATGVTLTGTGCGGGNGGGDPPTSTNGLLLTPSTATPAVGAAFTVSWNVSNATSCVGSVTSGVAANVTGWTTVTSPTSPRTVTITASGTYGLVLTCSNTSSANTLVSPVLAITAGSSSGTACTTVVPGYTSGQIQVSDIQYPNSATLRRGMDVTNWNNIWGYFNSTDTQIPWPGYSGSAPILKSFTRYQYVAAHFRTGSNTALSGKYVTPYNVPQPNVDMSISTVCGDFSSIPAGCLATNVPINGNSLVQWAFNTSNTSKCNLQPNTDYWVNLKFTDPTSTDGCTAASNCPISVQQNQG